MNTHFAMPDAAAEIRGGKEAPHLWGTCHFYQKSNGVWVVTHLWGLPPSATGFFAFHIHEGSSCAEGFTLTKGHYDPEKVKHPSHAGDLPPLLSCDGEAYLAVLTNRFTVKEIIGKTVVVHSDPDDFHSQPAGNAGHKIACGVIGKRTGI